MSRFSKFKNFINGDDDDYDEGDYIDDEDGSAVRRTSRRGDDEDKVLRINAKTRLMVTLVKPKDFDECRDIADSLKAQNAVVLNLEDTNPPVAGRIVDFLSGVAYANNGSIKRVAKSTFIITPFDVDISGMGADDLDLQF